MLEHSRLLLSPWHAEAGTRSVRSIRDAWTKEPLGLVRQLRSRTWRLLRWLARPTWHVLETEDESLLMTVYPAWGIIRPWEVHDADERLVCSIHDGEIFDVAGSLQARTTHVSGQTRIVGREKLELAEVAQHDGTLELHFAPPIEADPFAKMAMLGAALTLDWR